MTGIEVGYAIAALFALVAIANLAFALFDPGWKEFNAVLVMRLATWIARELNARASAQRAGRTASRSAYLAARAHAGNWSPAVRELSPCASDAAAEMPSAAACPVEVM